MIDGGTFTVLFDGDLAYQTKISHVYEATNLSLKESYLEISQTRGYLIFLIIFLTVFRLSFLPLDLFIVKRQMHKERIAEQISQIRVDTTDFKEQSKHVRDCYKKNGINTSHDVLLLVFKISLMLFIFSVVINGTSLEPKNWLDSRSLINGLIGTFLFPIMYFSNKNQSQVSANLLMTIGLPVILYACSVMFFSVTLMIFILLMQAFNLLGNAIGRSYFNTLAIRNNNDKI